jgi:predicted XRE-type DNA-binding protein
MDMISDNVHFLVLRANGLREDIFQFVFDTIKRYDSIDIKAIYSVKWDESERKEKLLSFYDHIKDKAAIEDIMKVNDAIMLAVILYDNDPIPSKEKTSGINWHIIRIKRIIRAKFGNVVHLSDTEELAYKQIKNMLGLDRSDVAEVIKSEGISVREVSTNHEVVTTMNKIKDGKEVLWTPGK